MKEKNLEFLRRSTEMKNEGKTDMEISKELGFPSTASYRRQRSLLIQQRRKENAKEVKR